MSFNIYALNAIEKQLERIASALEKMPCPTPSGASADTSGSNTTDQTHADARTCATATHSDAHVKPTAPPPTEDPEMVARVRAMQGSPEVANRGWSNGAALDLVAAYDAERAHHARTTQTLCTERAALTIERARVAKIAAILSDDTLEHPQKIGRALRVAEGAS